MAETSKLFIVGVGELLWDLLPGRKQLGGAPGNFVHHASQLGADALVISCVGNDPLGREALEHLTNLGLRTAGVSIDPTVPTGVSEITLDPQGKPTFVIKDPAAWDFIQVNENLLRQASRANVICFGTLGQRHPEGRAIARSLVCATASSALRIFDLNLRQAFWSPEVIVESMQIANVVKLNDEELPIVARVLGIDGDENSLLRKMAERFELRAIALTKGANGSVLLAGDTISSQGASHQTIVDTVGAGDAFTATLAVGLSLGRDLAAIQKAATAIAGYVCSCPGATPQLPVELRAAFAAEAAS